MRTMMRCGSLMLALVLVLPILAVGAEKGEKEKGKGAGASDQDYKKLAAMHEVTAKLISTDGKNVSFRVEFQVPEMPTNPPRPTYTSRRPYLPRPPQIRFVTEHLDFDLPLTADAKLRTMILPQRYDEKGFNKVYTAQEKAELKGKEGLPGYTATADEMKNGQIVKLTLVHPPKPADKEMAETKPSVSRIVVLQEGQALPGMRSDQTKKK